MAQKIVALEIAGDRVRAAVAQRSWKTMEVLGVYEQHRAPGEPDLSPAMRRLLERTGRPDIAISALPAARVAQRVLLLPFNDRRRLQQTVPFELEEQLPLSLEEIVVAFARLGSEERGTMVFAACASKEEIRQHLELIAAAGLDPKTVTIGAFALAGFFGRAHNSRGGPHLLLDIDHGETSIVLLDENGKPLALRTVAAGLQPADGGSIVAPAAETVILGAVRQTLLAHGLQEEPELVLTGPASHVPTLRSQIAQGLAMEAHGAEEFDCATQLPGLRPEGLRFASCVAMLLGEVPGTPLELPNFRQGEYAFRGRTSDLTPFRVPAILAGAVAFFALLHFALGLRVSLKQLSALNRDIAALATPVLGHEPKGDARAELMSGIRQMNRRLKLMGAGSAAHPALDTLLALSRALPPRLQVEIEEVTVDESGLKVSGKADSFTTVGRVKDLLGESPYFGNIELTGATGEAAGADQHNVEFHLSAGFGDQPARKGGGHAQ